MEIIAAIALAATTLGYLLVIFGRLHHQERIAKERLAAVHAADKILNEWFAPQQAPPFPEADRSASGSLEQPPGWKWRLTKIDERSDRLSEQHGLISPVKYHFEIFKPASGEFPEETLIGIELLGHLKTSQNSVGGNSS